MIAWMLYAALVGAIVAVGGLALERLAAAMGQPRRIAWLAALTLAVAIPLAGIWRAPETAPVVVVGAKPEPAVVAGDAVENLWSVIPTLPVPEDVSTGRIAVLAWAAGSLASLAVLAGVLVLIARGPRRWERTSVHGTEVYVSRRFGPALVGVARPEVVIPAWVLDLEPTARETVIRHEAEHARARDHLVLLYGGLLAAAFPWSPAIWWMYRRLRAAVELDCDQRVLASGIGVADYGDVLLGAGCRSRGRWGFSPAMGQPESLLERRLKTMSETGRKPSGGYVALLAAVAVGALAAACDTPVPTEVREAFEEVMAEEEVQDGQTDWVERFLHAKAFGSQPAPLLYVDGVRIRKSEDLPGSARGWSWDSDTGSVRICCAFDASNIARIEVLKGPAAAKLYGNEAASGVIQIFTEDGGLEAEVITVPSVSEDPTPIWTPDGRIVVWPSDRAAISISHRDLVIQSDTLMVTGLPGQRDWETWFSEKVIATAASDSRPVIYVDGVRVDEGTSGLNALLPDGIDRIEVIRGEDARKKYGEEGANGVILIFTKNRPSDTPSIPSRR